MSDDLSLIAEIETTAPDGEGGYRSWLTFHRRHGYTLVSREEMGPGDIQRRVDPEAGVAIDDPFLDAFIMSLQAARSART